MSKAEKGLFLESISNNVFAHYYLNEELQWVIPKHFKSTYCSSR